MKPDTQPGRLYAFLYSHPASSSLEIQQAMRITNATGRLSDLRDEAERTGRFQLVKARRSDGRFGYSVEPVSDGTLGLIAS